MTRDKIKKSFLFIVSPPFKLKFGTTQLLNVPISSILQVNLDNKFKLKKNTNLSL